MEPPKVTGLSPKEGEPGTKVTIRGENLGTSQRDLLSLSICGVECLMYAEWHSPSKIVARCGAVRVPQYGDVIVTTKSGGKGTCTVQFKVLVRCIGLTDESAVWVDESWFGKNRPTSPSQLYPDDPLRLSDESSVERFPVDELQELFPEGSGDILSPNFQPIWYLLENHHGARFDDLKTGLAFLRRKVSTHDEGPLAFMKSNVSSVMSCLEALDTMKSTLEKDVQALGNDLAVPAEQAIQKAKEEAFGLFEEMLTRKEKADSTRNALSVLQRFRFLFNLPANIEKNIRKGDYEMVINDYARAKSLFHDTEVAVFKRVYQEVEQRIEQFREMLLEKLKNQPSTVEEQKRLVKFLVNLETPNDPAWQCVCHNKGWLLSVLNETKDKHTALAASTENRENFNSFSQLDMPQVVKFIVDITEKFSDHFPNMWKLGQAYLGGQLHIRENSESNDKQGLPKNIQFKNMVIEVMKKLCCLIRMGILPDSLHSLSVQQLQALGTWPKAEHLTPWLPYCLRSIRNCFSGLLKLELPEDMLNPVQLLIFDLKVHAMKTLFSQASQDIQNLDERETWVVEIDDINGGTTQLPLLFENRVVETLQLVRETVLQCGPKETDIFLQINVQAAVKQSSLSLLQAFATALDKMAQALKNKDNKQLKQLSPRIAPVNHSMFMDEENDKPSDEAKCLIILSNCSYTVKSVIPRLQDSLNKYGYPDMQLVIKSSVTRFHEVSSKLFDLYVERKCDPVVGAIEPRMYAGSFNWELDYKPTGVSLYIKQTIMDMIEIHSEVFAISPPIVSKVLTKVVEAVVEELARLYECTDNYEGNSNIQATLNIRALEDAMSAYKTSQTSKHFMACRGKLKPFPYPKDAELVNELLRTFKNQIWLQLLCFKEEGFVTV
ncbi:exocyst complex component 2 [Trichonephila clavata]|uniref:Exocyst complex component 2 n=1 Tax=Trichonephila clavata TaxID=2740835 RepID=A0A8X6G3E9_TRICU|nr:exocyst complex component 2 [Trichonephila clavata]